MQRVRIYEVRTELADTAAGRTYDRFNVAAISFYAAYAKAVKRAGKYKTGERIQDIREIASEG